MPVIAMTREMGTLGKEVAAGVAERLGLEVVHHELVESELARRLRLGESEVHRFLEGTPKLLERWRNDRGGFARMTELEVLELAARGNVVLRGWGATHVLRGLTHVLCVRVCAPMDFRVQVMVDRLGIEDPQLAEAEIERNDAAHARTLQGMFAADWRDPTAYHLVLNTARIPIEQCVEQLCVLLASPALAEDQAARAALDDALLRARVGAALHEAMAEVGGDRHIRLDVKGGRVRMTGAAPRHASLAEVEQVVRGVSGVHDIDNELIRMSGMAQ